MSNGLGHLTGMFREHRITGDVLLDLSSDDLNEIGIQALGDKKRLLRLIAQMRNHPQGCHQMVAPLCQDLGSEQLQQASSMQHCEPWGPPTCPDLRAEQFSASLFRYPRDSQDCETAPMQSAQWL